jgi:hypothetical protein
MPRLFGPTGLESEASACCCLPTDRLGHRAMLVEAQLSPAGSSSRIRIAQRPRAAPAMTPQWGLSARATSYDRQPCTPAPFGVGPALFSIPVSDRGALRRLSRLYAVELPVALFNAASHAGQDAFDPWLARLEDLDEVCRPRVTF